MSKSLDSFATTSHIDLIKEKVADLKKGNGSILCFTGETGYGKSHVLEVFSNEVGEHEKEITGVIVEGQAPIGKFNLANIRPLLPFNKALEKLMENKVISSSAKSKFAKNAGMTILASLPITGEIFYAVKELGRDWREYKKDKQATENKELSSATRDYYDSICAYADRRPLVILIDDMHWCDAQSVELLNIFAENIKDIPIILAFTVKESVLLTYASPLKPFLDKFDESDETLVKVDLHGFTQDLIGDFAKVFIKDYRKNVEFEKWIFDKSHGVPGVIFEYLKYFSENLPFKEDGSLVDDFYEINYTPAGVQTAFSQSLQILNENDKNLLAVCSAEGREFTASIASSLLNTDIVSAIRNFRDVQNKTGIIKSLGAVYRYGQKTTLYEFTQGYYYNYFQDMLEYEERIALHGQIASILKKKFEDAGSDELREEIAPYLAAHSMEAEDNETAKDMLMVTAGQAKKYGNNQIIENTYDDFKELEDKIKFEKRGEEVDFEKEHDFFKQLLGIEEIAQAAEDAGDNGAVIVGGNGGGDGYFESVDFKAFRKELVEDFHTSRFEELIEKIDKFISEHDDYMRTDEKAQLLSIKIRAYVENSELSKADKTAGKALELINGIDDPIAECFIYNSCSSLSLSKNNIEQAFNYLKKAADRAAGLPSELKLITLSNISLLLQSTKNNRYKHYRRAVEELSKRFRFDELKEEVLR